MQAKLFRIKLRPNSQEKLVALLETMKANMLDVLKEMEQKGYYWDSVFLEKLGSDDYMTVLIKSKDFSQTKGDEGLIDKTPFRAIYNAFKSECWADEPYELTTALHCFNKIVQIY